MNTIRFEVGNRIRKLRTKKAISQEKLAELSNLNTSYIGQIERGEKNPSIDTIYHITNALGVSMSSLFENITPSENANIFANKVYALMLTMDEKHSKALFDIAYLLSDDK